MNAFLSLVVTNARLIVRNRQTLIWSLAFPILLMVLLGAFFGNTTSPKVAAELSARGPLAPVLARGLGAIPGFHVQRTSAPAAVADVRSGNADLALVLDPGTPAHLTVFANPESVKGNPVILLGVEELVARLNAAGTHAPPLLLASYRSVAADNFNYIAFLVPGILAMEVLSTGLFSGLALVTYRERGILRRLRATPLGTGTFLAARVVTQLALTVVQLGLTLGVASLFFAYHPVGNAAAAAVALLLGALAFTAIGFFVAGVARTADAASAIANLLNVVMMFLGGVFFPTSGFGGFFGLLIRIVPLGYLSAALRDTLSRGQGWAGIAPDVLPLLLTLAVAALVAARFFRWEDRPA
jgi:ABC-2 type transport system permease protein